MTFFVFLLFFVFVSSWSQNLNMQSCNFFFPFWISNHDHASLVIQKVKNLPITQETQVPSQGREVPLEKEMATHSSILAWRIPWTEDPGRQQSMGSQRIEHDWATKTLAFTYLILCLWFFLLFWKPPPPTNFINFSFYITQIHPCWVYKTTDPDKS